jgi:serralysin
MPKPVPNTQTGSLTDHQHGTNDTLILADAGTGGTPLQVVLYGDAFAQYDDSRGGNDLLIGGANANNSLVGDARLIYDNARGGNDTLIGDAGAFNVLYGDANEMHGAARGGNDHLIGGDGSSDNTLIGDAYFMSDNARGGNDTLVSGTGTDHMWGDAQSINGVAASPTAPTGAVVTGADTFVFAPANGNDDINDFRQSDHDRIDVRAYGFHDIADMNAA